LLKGDARTMLSKVKASGGFSPHPKTPKPDAQGVGEVILNVDGLEGYGKNLQVNFKTVN
jgi:hypothetical protein